jgi:glycosyltransferase involved in cell wall biosynthesis
MRILVDSHHRYPARHYPVSHGGIAGARITDNIVKGLTELGHDVFYHLWNGAEESLPQGVTLVSEPVWDVDILHIQGPDSTEPIESHGKPWVRTCHVDLAVRGQSRRYATSNWIFVSRTLAQSYGSERYVLNGIDPSEFIYSETKQDYFLFMGCLDRAMAKGLDIAVALSQEIGFDLVVAGSAVDRRNRESVTELCRRENVTLVGEVQGRPRAELLAGAKALLFPTQVNEAFGVVMAEALVSGTPVIASHKGACPELISSDVGFVCQHEPDYREAIRDIETLSPAACRNKGLRDFHYLRMARDYVREYEKEISRASS